MKSDGKMDCNWLKGRDGDAMHALLCGAGQNIRMILKEAEASYSLDIYPVRPKLGVNRTAVARRNGGLKSILSERFFGTDKLTTEAAMKKASLLDGRFLKPLLER